MSFGKILMLNNVERTQQGVSLSATSSWRAFATKKEGSCLAFVAIP